MNGFFSHFAITKKNIGALGLAVGGYLVLKGHMTPEELAACTAILFALLAFLKPRRSAQVKP